MIDAAAPGDTVIVPAGTWTAPILIDKPLTLEGQAWPVIQGDGSGDVIRIQSPDVTVRGFVVRGSGVSLDREDAGIRAMGANTVIENNRIEDALFGIYLEQAADSVVRGNTIHGMDLPISRRGDGLKVFYSPRTLIEANVMRDTRDALLWYSPYSIVRGNDFATGRYGLHMMQSDHHLIEENIFRNNSVGIYVMYGNVFEMRQNLLDSNRGPSGYGIGLKEASDVLLEGNRIVNNRAGVYSDASPLQPETTVTYRNNLLAYNEIGLEMLPNTQRNRFPGQHPARQRRTGQRGGRRRSDAQRVGSRWAWQLLERLRRFRCRRRRHRRPALHQQESVRQPDGRAAGIAPFPPQPGQRCARSGGESLPDLCAAAAHERPGAADAAARSAARARS